MGNEPLGKVPLDVLISAIQSGSTPIDRWLRICGTVDAKTLEAMVEGLLGLVITTEHEFQRRFPAEFAAWDRRNDGS